MNKLVFYFLFLTMVLRGQNKEANEWLLRKHENSIWVYSREAENSKFKELKSVLYLNTSLSSIVALLNDFESYASWVYRCAVSTTVRKLSPNESIHYQSMLVPWPANNRDFVVDVKVSQDKQTKVVVQNGICIPEALAFVENHVRIRKMQAMWTLTPLADGRVKVEYQLQVDPGGSLPAWLVNLAVVDGPYETAAAMKKQILLEKYQKAKLDFIVEP